MNQIKFRQIKRTWKSGYLLHNEEVDWLLEEVERLSKFEHEYICNKCGLRQNSNKEQPNF